MNVVTSNRNASLCVTGLEYKSAFIDCRPMICLHRLRGQPGGLNATLVKLSLAVFALNAKAHVA